MALKPVYIDISLELQDWLKAVKGKQVRAANVSALTKIQDQANAAIDFVVEKGDTIDTSVVEVQTVKEEAQAAVDHANEITAEYKQYADTKLSQTEAQRQLAETAKQEADDAAALAESWTVGGTGVRPDENTNNASYWCQQSKTDADRATTEADRAAQYSQIVAPGFYLDVETATLYIKTGVGVDFIVEDSRIYWKITA